eukprot:2421854-Amphidinium_carterae.1
MSHSAHCPQGLEEVSSCGKVDAPRDLKRSIRKSSNCWGRSTRVGSLATPGLNIVAFVLGALRVVVRM